MKENLKPQTGIRGWSIAGLVASVVMFGGVAAWAWQTNIAGAVVAQGTVVVTGKTKPVQHADGGTVDEIFVTDGSVVQSGDVLMRLDDTELRANIAIYRTRLAGALAQESRLIAERSAAETVVFSDGSPFVDPLALDSARAGQQEIFDARRAVRRVQQDQLAEQIDQFTNQLGGIEALLAAKTDQLAFLGTELSAMSDLAGRGLALSSQVLGLQRQQSDLLGQVAEHRSEAARIQNSIHDARLSALQQEGEFREAVVTQLAEVMVQIHELTEQIATTEAQLDRVSIRAPVSGRVHEMQVATVGAVVPPGGVLLEIVPDGESLTFEVRIPPISIDQVFPGQSATARFTAFNQRTTPVIDARVRSVSPNSVVDEATGQSFYRVFLEIEESELAKLGDVSLIPGMPLDSYLKTGDRSVLSYLVRPVQDQFAQAFREQ
ncbi:MAG: HlyD family type I secretion periplasmic adaptor subunit [Jannaschia sp.]